MASVTSELSNGKSVDLSNVSIVAAGIAAAALLVSAISVLVATSGGGDTSSNSSPGFTEVIHWFGA